MVALAVTLQVATQLVVLNHEVAGTLTFHDEYARAAADLRQLGIRPPCLINESQRIPIAFYAQCASTPSSQGARPPANRLLVQDGQTRFAILEWIHQAPPAYARTWPRTVLPGTGLLTLVVYLPPHGAG